MKGKINKLCSIALILVVLMSASFGTIGTVIADSNYTNDGEKITVSKAASINLANEKHTEKDGKLFIGWKKQNNTWPKATASYAAGDVLTAQYIDFTDSDFAIDRVYLTDSNGVKLNMGYTQTAAIGNIPTINERGVIWVKTDYSGGREIRPDEEIVRSWMWFSPNINDFMPGATIDYPNKAANTNTASISVSASEYDEFYTARGYIKYTDKNGVAGAVYTYEESWSAYKAAKQATDSKPFYKTIISNVETANKAYVDGITENVSAVFSKDNPSYKRNTDSYDVFSYVYSDGTNIAFKRTAWITDTGIKETVNLGWLSDIHFNYINQTDVDKQVINALASYRGRSWMRDGTTISRAISQINYSNKRYKKTIVRERLRKEVASPFGFVISRND